jgi:hypothetical protein
METSLGPGWIHVIALGGGTGLLMAVLACFVGLKQRFEIILWTLLYAAWVLIVRQLGWTAPFRTILFAGPIAGIVTATVSMALFDQYKRQNPWYAEQFDKPKSKLAGGFFGMGVGMGLMYGAIFGGIAWWLAR